jgi:predicted Zn-dependent protease
MAAQVTGMIIGLKYSRQDEREADFGGLTYMVRAGYDPRGMVKVMQTLESLNNDSPPEFFSTHPSPEKRRIEQRYASATGLKIGKEKYTATVLSQLESTKNSSVKGGDTPEDVPEKSEPNLTAGSHMSY